ncbi:MAG TPA: BON domain-containing protein, partial [Chloroflexi bacterium]|nr:BON domain-containing protein [Chloroflexota bacterium]
MGRFAMAVDTQARTTTVSTHDELLEELVFEALCRDEIFRSLEQDSIQVDVKNGVVYLKGHLSKSLHSHHLEAIAAAVPGVRGVENRLMADRDLSLQVAQALSHDPRTRPFNIPVRAFHGWVHLGGMVPTETDRAACEQVAGSVSGVRGVITLPKLPDGSE